MASELSCAVVEHFQRQRRNKIRLHVMINKPIDQEMHLRLIDGIFFFGNVTWCRHRIGCFGCVWSLINKIEHFTEGRMRGTDYLINPIKSSFFKLLLAFFILTFPLLSDDAGQLVRMNYVWTRLRVRFNRYRVRNAGLKSLLFPSYFWLLVFHSRQ